MKKIHWSIKILLSLVLLFALCVLGVFIFFSQIKEGLIQQGISKLNEHMDAKVSVNPNIELTLLEDFPHATFVFHDVIIYESKNFNSNNTLASVQKLALSFNLIEVLIHKNYVLQKISLHEGYVLPKVNAEGMQNFKIFKTNTKAKEDIILDIQHIELDHIFCSYLNAPSEQTYELSFENSNASFKLDGDEYDIVLEGDILVKGLLINKETYFANRPLDLTLNMHYQQEKEVFIFKQTSLHINQSEYVLNGTINTKNQTFIQLDIASASSKISNLTSLLPKKYADQISQYQNDGDVYFNGSIVGYASSKQNPAIDFKFGFKNTTISNPDGGQKIKNATLVGSFSNGKSHNANTSSFTISQFKGTLNNNPIEASIALSNFNDPYLKVSAKLEQNIKDVFQFASYKHVDSLEGNMKLSFEFEGKTNHLKRKEDLEKIKVNGEFQIDHGRIYSKLLDKTFNNLSADIIFNHSDVSINHLSFNTKQSDIKIEGFMKNFLRKLILDKGSVLIDGSLVSNRLNYSDFMLPASEDKKDGKSNVVLMLQCNIKELNISDIKSRNVKGDLYFNDSLLTLNNASLNFAGGKISGDVSMDIKLPHRSKHINLSTQFNQMHTDSMLYLLDDFSQDFITHKNLSGRLSGKANLFFIINPDGKIVTESILANLEFNMEDGRLQNFAPLMKLSKFAEEEQLKNIRFSKLTNQIMISNNVITIPTMRILSNVCDIEIAGTHTLNNEFTYRLKVPLKNLSKRRQAEAASYNAIENPGLQSKTNIFLIIEGKGDQFEVKYDKQSVRKKIEQDLQREKEELKDAFQKEQKEKSHSKVNDEEFFDF